MREGQEWGVLFCSRLSHLARGARTMDRHRRPPSARLNGLWPLKDQKKNPRAQHQSQRPRQFDQRRPP
jgi:hypothetical protein